MKPKTVLQSSGIYVLTAPSGGQYVGSAVCIYRRFSQHKTELRRGTHKNKILQNAWAKHGEEGFTFVVLLVCRATDLLLYEQAAIDALQPRYNICQIAGNSLGTTRTEEYKLGRSVALTGRTLSPEHREKIAAALRGRVVPSDIRPTLGRRKGWKQTEEAKAKMRGRRRTPEHCAKLSAVARGRTPHNKGVRCPDHLRARIAAKLKGNRNACKP
jgi:group I intron endonuclease